MKNKLFTILVVGVAVIGLFYAFNTYIYNAKQADPAQTAEGFEVGFTGVVTNIDLEGVAFDGPALVELETGIGETHVVAVPSMSLALCEGVENIADAYSIEVGDVVSVRGLLNESEQVVPCEEASHYLIVSTAYLNEESGLRFKYKKSPDGYVRESENFVFSNNPDFVDGVMLMNAAEAEALEGNTEGREGPPAMHILVYKNSDRILPAAWTQSNREETNANLALSEPSDTTVAGAEAVQFIADGLYAARVYVIAHGEHIVVARGEYLDQNSEIYKDFENLVDSIEFASAAE